MKIRAIVKDITKVKADALIVSLFEGVKRPSGATGAVNKALNGAIAKLIASGEIKGKVGETTVIHVFGQLPADRVAVLGLGPAKTFDVDTVRRAMGTACRALRERGVTRIATVLHGAGAGGLAATEAAHAVAEGASLGLYRYQKLGKKPEKRSEVQEITIVESSRAKLAEVKRGIDVGCVMADSVALARDMSNSPANLMTPTHMADIAKDLAKEAGLKVTIFERKDMERLKMGALLGVAKGSEQPPKFIVLKYLGDPANPDKVIGLVGKGVTFDSGGISLKPAGGMAEMKTDMSGGGAVIAAMRAIGLLNPKINVTGLVPASENMPSAAAQKPGDVVTALNGKTIEVDNTDAEGRLLLADALSYGNTLGLSPMIDVATLTGAILVSLGKVYTGAFTNHQQTLDKLKKAAAAVGEKVWQLPIDDEYKTQNSSDVADVKNTGGRNAGSITAAMFLHEFSEQTPWVHLDIAGTARSNTTKGYIVKGSSGIPVRTLVRYVLDAAGGLSA